MVAQMMDFVNPAKLPIIDPQIMLGNELGEGPGLVFKGLQMVYSDLYAARQNLARKEQLLLTLVRCCKFCLGYMATHHLTETTGATLCHSIRGSYLAAGPRQAL